MKKLFVSIPMRGRDTENIARSFIKLHKIAESIVGEELELIQSFILAKAPAGVNESIWYLGESIKMMAEADYFACVRQHYEYNGCAVESFVARRYGIPTILIDREWVCPDIKENENLENFEE